MNDVTTDGQYPETVEGICELVDRILREATGEAIPATTPDTELLVSGLLDSLTIMKIVAKVEHSFGVTLAERAIIASNFRTPRALWAAIQTAAPAQGGTVGVRG